MIKGLPRQPEPTELVALDLELFKMGDRLHRPTGMFACLSIAMEKGGVYQVYDTADLRRAIEILQPGYWVFHNAMFDLAHLRRWVDVPQRQVWDTMLIEQDLYGGYYDSYALDALTRRYLSIPMSKEERKSFEGAETMTDEMARYAANDVESTLHIAQLQMKHIEDNAENLKCYYEIDEPAMWAALDMKPIRVDVDGWLQLAEKHEAQAQAIAEGLDFNPGSHVQTKAAIKAITGRAPSDTRKETLANLRDEGVLVAGEIMRYRTIKKAASSYGKTWVEKNVEDGGMVYSAWRITGAETGRMASRTPNLQNIPARTMPEFRSLFLPHEDETLIVADVAAQEPRVAAWWSKDEVLLDVLEKDEDVYMPVMEAAGIDRFQAKTVFLGLLYDLTDHGLADRLKISKTEAQTIMRKVMGRLKGVAVWKNKAKAQAYQREYAVTPTGRRVWLNLYSPQWERNAVNAPIQGGAADMTKATLASLHMCHEFHVCMVVHDEIVASVPLDMAENYANMVAEAWVDGGQAVIPGVPIKADVHIGSTWAAKSGEVMEDEDEEQDNE